MGSDTWRLCNANYDSISCQNGAIGAILSEMASHKRYLCNAIISIEGERWKGRGGLKNAPGVTWLTGHDNASMEATALLANASGAVTVKTTRWITARPP